MASGTKDSVTKEYVLVHGAAHGAWPFILPPLRPRHDRRACRGSGCDQHDPARDGEHGLHRSFVRDGCCSERPFPVDSGDFALRMSRSDFSCGEQVDDPLNGLIGFMIGDSDFAGPRRGLRPRGHVGLCLYARAAGTMQ